MIKEKKKDKSKKNKKSSKTKGSCSKGNLKACKSTPSKGTAFGKGKSSTKGRVVGKKTKPVNLKRELDKRRKAATRKAPGDDNRIQW